MSTDWFDGRIARRAGRTSSFGSLLDPVADKVLVLATLVVLLDAGCLPRLDGRRDRRPRDAVSGLRLAALERGVVIPARDLGKLKTWSQAIAAGGRRARRGRRVADSIAWWCLLVAVALTWVSGLDYARSAPRVLRGRAVASPERITRSRARGRCVNCRHPAACGNLFIPALVLGLTAGSALGPHTARWPRPAPSEEPCPQRQRRSASTASATTTDLQAQRPLPQDHRLRRGRPGRRRLQRRRPPKDRRLPGGTTAAARSSSSTSR